MITLGKMAYGKSTLVAATHSISTVGIRTFGIMTLMTLGLFTLVNSTHTITTLGIRTFGIMTSGKTTLGIMTFSKMTLHNNKNCDTQHR